MVDILDEVKEELRQESLTNSFLKYLPYVIGALVVIIMIISLKSWWTSYRNNKVYAEGGNYILSINKMRSQNLEEAIGRLDQIKEGSSNYAALANINLAGYEIFKKNFIAASEAYARITANKSNGKLFKDYASIQVTLLNLANNKIDINQAIGELESYVSSQGIFLNSAEEILLNLYIKQGNFTKAKEISNMLITDAKTPEPMRIRVEQISQLL